MATSDQPFWKCVWKECPDDVDEGNKYFVGKTNPMAAVKCGGDDGYCTIIWNTPLPLNKVTSWSIKILNSKRNDDDGRYIYVGVAPSNINQNVDCNRNKCG